MDVLGAFEKVRDSYIDYVKTAFATQFPGLEEERERLLRQPGTICQEPWIEPIPRYRTTGKKIWDLDKKDMPNFSEQDVEDFKKLAACGLVGDFELYDHQVRMLSNVLAGENAVVTAGTGSGKTESFLLPLFAYLVHESKRWAAPGPRLSNQDDWWQNPTAMDSNSFGESPRIQQRANELRQAAMRSMVLYPMNALVEDQMSRLRLALDSPAARNWFDQNRSGNRIYFGRYNSSTPVPGHELGASFGSKWRTTD